MLKMSRGWLAGPLALLFHSAPAAAATVCEARWTDAAREDRVVPIRIRMPEGSGKAALIVFSHGLGGSLDGGAAWAEHWSNAGFAVINVQHAGSDRAVVGRGLARAMSAEQLIARARDVRFVIDTAGRKRREGNCDLRRLDLARIGMSGHSFGAHTAQAVAGQNFPGLDLSDRRVRAAVALSPAPPQRGSAERAFADIRIPFFSITGTDDKVPLLTRTTPADREVPFRKMPPGGKYLLVLDGADHADMGGPRGDGARRPGRRLRAWLGGRNGKADDAHFERTIAAATTDFWRWTLLGDARARARLDALPARLRSGDRFERK